MYAEEYPRPDFNFMIEKTVELLEEYNITFDSRCRIFIDGANPSFIRSLKEGVDEDSNFEQQVAYYKKTYRTVYDLEFLQQNMFVIPVPFAKYHRDMLSKCKQKLEYRNGSVAINPKFTKLIT